jgi:hypothetical protein
MTDAGLLPEIAAMRLVLVHCLARLRHDELREMSEAIYTGMKQVDDAGGMEAEAAFASYHEAVDGILAAALKRSPQLGRK